MQDTIEHVKSMLQGKGVKFRDEEEAINHICEMLSRFGFVSNDFARDLRGFESKERSLASLMSLPEGSHLGSLPLEVIDRIWHFAAAARPFPMVPHSKIRFDIIIIM